MRNPNFRAQQNRELWVIRRVAPRLLDDRPARLECDPRARARLAFERLFLKSGISNLESPQAGAHGSV